VAAQPAKVRQSCSATDYYYYSMQLTDIPQWTQFPFPYSLTQKIKDNGSI
jgi:hypothetical protein